MVTQEEYTPENIIINHEIEEETQLYFSDLVFNDDATIKIEGNINSNDNVMGNPIIIGAYTVKNDEIIEISANTFKIKNQTSSFILEFDKNDIDTIYLYADYLKTNPIISENTEKTTNTDNNFSIQDRLMNSFDIDEEKMNRLHLEIKNLGIQRDSDNAVTVYCEVHSEYKKINENINVEAVLYDKYNNILGNGSIYLHEDSFYDYQVDSWYFYPVKIAQIDRIKIYPSLR